MRTLLTLLAMLILVACGQPADTTTTQGGDAPAAMLEPSPTPYLPPVPVATPTPLPEYGYQLFSSGYNISHRGKATASVEERTYLSDVVVKARLVSAGSDVLNFTAIQYLKGTGPKKFKVWAETDGRNTQWDEQDAVLFLRTLTGQTEDFEFTDSTTWDYLSAQHSSQRYTGVLPEGYTIGTRNPVWLPVGSGTAARSPSAGNDITDVDAVGAPVSLSLSALTDIVDWTSGSTSAARTTRRSIPGGASSSGVTPEQYAQCIKGSLGDIRRWRDFEAHSGDSRKVTAWATTTTSGAPQGTAIIKHDRTYYPAETVVGYDKILVRGPGADQFVSRLTDDDNSARTGYVNIVSTVRPLPAGTYTFHFDSYRYAHQICEFNPQDVYMLTTVNVTAPPGTVHEALFDPATTTAGVGYLATTSTTTGVLEPVGFSVRGRAITITGLTWQNGRVVLTLDRFGSWLDGFSFIEPDGTVGLRLAEVDATKDWTARTLTWEVSEQPWEPGDELMMRMGPIPLPAVRNVTAERGSDREVVLSWEVPYRAGVSGYRIWRHQPGRDEGPKVYVADTRSTDTTFTDEYSPLPNLTEYSVQAIDRSYNAGESSESVRVGSQ